MAKDEKEIREEFSEEDSIITLTDGDGREVEFELLDIVDYKDKSYMILLEKDAAPEQEGEVVILEMSETEDDEEVELNGVDDEEILEAVFGIFKERFEDEFDIEE